MPAFLEERYRRKHLNCVRHITLDPKGHGVVRIHMIPPRQDAADAPFLLLLNGDKLVPLNLSWAILLANFMDRWNPLPVWRSVSPTGAPWPHPLWPRPVRPIPSPQRSDWPATWS